MKKELFEAEAYVCPDCKVLNLIAEASLMLTGSVVEEGDWDPEDEW